MRCRRAIRTVFVYALLGAVATVASSWAIHGWHRWSMARAGTLAMWSQDDTRTVHTMHQPVVDFSAPPWTAHRRVPEAHAWAWDGAFPMGGVTRRERFGWRRDSWAIAVIQFAGPDGADLERPGGSWEELVVIRVGWPMRAIGAGAFSGAFGHFEASPSPGRHQYDAFTRTPALSLRGGYAPGPWPTRSDWPPRSALTGYRALDRFALPLLPLWPGFAINTAFYALLLFALIRGPRVLRRELRRRRGRCGACGYDRVGLAPGAACPECGAGVRASTRRDSLALP
jgi:hypothetical protein